MTREFTDCLPLKPQNLANSPATYRLASAERTYER